MPSMLNRFDAVHGDDGQVYYDDGERDTISVLQDGVRVLKPVAATDEEKRQSQVGALHRERAGISRRLEHLGADHLGQRPPAREDIERTRVELEAGLVAVDAELARLDPKANARTRR